MSNYRNPIPTVDEEKNSVEATNNIGDYSCLDSVYFAFIDILGFKKTFDDIRENEGDGPVDKYRDVFNYYFELMDATNFMINKANTGCYAGQTSDSLYFYTPRADMLIEFIKVFSHFHLYAMMKNVFFRGGIAKGKLFFKEDYQFYGDSVIKAFLLESTVSRFPVIVIDENTYEDIKSINGWDILIENKNERNYIKPFVYLETNLDLDIRKESLAEIREMDIDLIKKNIHSNKKLFEYDSKNFEKYVFLMKEFDKAMNNDNEK